MDNHQFQIEPNTYVDKEQIKLVNDIYSNNRTLSFSSPDPEESDYKFEHLNHKELQSRWARWAMEAIVLYFGGWDDPKRQTLVQKRTTGQSVCNAYFKIGLFASRYYPNVRISEWSSKHVDKLIRCDFNLKLQHGGAKSHHAQKNPYASFSAVEKTLICLAKTEQAALSKIISDGLHFKLPKIKTIIRSALEQEVLNYGLLYVEWEKGESHQAVDAVLASIMTAQAITIIESPKARFLRDYYSLQRKSEGSILCTETSLFKRRTFKFAFDPNFDLSELRQQNGSKLRESDLDKKKIYFELINRHRDQLPPLKETGFPFISMKELHDEVDAIYDSCYWLFLTMTGIRQSEISSLNGDSYDEAYDTYRTKIKKTDNSANHDRGGANLLLQLFNILNDLSLTPKKERVDREEVPLFAKTYFHDTNSRSTLHSQPVRSGESLPINLSSRKVIQLGNSRKAFDNRLKRFCINFAESQPEFAEEVMNIGPHQLRHTFVQFILRRFESYMHEPLRVHLRHAAGSYMTNVYERNKLKDDEKIAMERGYINEIVRRIYEQLDGKIGIEGNESFYGKAANRISHLIKKIELHQPEEIEKALFSIASKVESINANDYGYCVVLKETRSQSNCFDKSTNTPLIENGQLDICSGCVNFLYSKESNEAAIVNHRFLHANQIEIYQKLGVSEDSPVMKSSKASVKNAEKLLKDMGGK